MQHLFEEFPTQDKAQWLKQASKDLKGENLEEALAWHTEEEGLTLMPFFTNEDLEGLSYLKNQANASFDAAEAAMFGNARNWSLRRRIAVDSLKQANQAIKDGFKFNKDPYLDLSAFSGTFEAEALFDGIMLPFCKVSLIMNLGQWDDFGRSNALQADRIQGSITRWLSGTPIEWHWETIGFSNFKGLPVHHEASAKNVGERIGSLLFETLKMIEGVGRATDAPNTLGWQIPGHPSYTSKEAHIAHIFLNMEWHWVLGNNYFFHLAGLRALRLLLVAMAHEYGVALDPAHLSIAAHTNIASAEKTAKNPEWNILSNTTQAMSAIIGGCNALCIAPHNGASNDAFAERIAANISNLMNDEAYLGKVADPAAGSFYLEALTDRLAQLGWDNFRQRL